MRAPARVDDRARRAVRGAQRVGQLEDERPVGRLLQPAAAGDDHVGLGQLELLGRGGHDVLQAHAGRGDGDLEPLDGRRARRLLRRHGVGTQRDDRRRRGRGDLRDAFPATRGFVATIASPSIATAVASATYAALSRTATARGGLLPGDPRGEEDRARGRLPRGRRHGGGERVGAVAGERGALDREDASTPYFPSSASTPDTFSPVTTATRSTSPT